MDHYTAPITHTHRYYKGTGAPQHVIKWHFIGLGAKCVPCIDSLNFEMSELKIVF